MNKIKFILLAMALSVASGCAESSALIKANSTSMRMDVFEELTNGGTAPKGFADLHITATLKTHKPGIYSASDIHGFPEYKLLLNIDGQAMLLQGSLQSEKNELGKPENPEVGDGIRYRFSKNLRVKAGAHRIVVALPDDEIAVEREITLTEGNTSSLVLEPIYSTKPGKRRPANYNTTSFTEGIRSIRLMLNGRE